MPDKDTEHTLTFAAQTAVVSPFGAALRRYFLTHNGLEWNAVWGYHGGANKRGGQGDVLIPFPGRIKGGVYSLRGQNYELAQNDKDGPNAIHGFLRAQLFATERVSRSEAVFSYQLGEIPIAGYPFTLAIEVAYSLGADGLSTRFQIRNLGANPAPAGAGFHPYFCGDRGAVDDWQVTIAARDYIELENFVPTGRVLPVQGTALDFRAGRMVGATRYNDCVARLERDAQGWSTAWVVAPDSPRRISIRMDQNFDYVVVYTGDQIPAPANRQGFALEPMTCAPDAFNHAAWGLRVLAPGEVMSGCYVIRGLLNFDYRTSTTTLP